MQKDASRQTIVFVFSVGVHLRLLPTAEAAANLNPDFRGVETVDLLRLATTPRGFEAAPSGFCQRQYSGDNFSDFGAAPLSQ
jgi:hypothetical protein